MALTASAKIEPLKYETWHAPGVRPVAPMPPLPAEAQAPAELLLGARVRELEQQLAAREQLALRQVEDARAAALGLARDAQQSETLALQMRTASSVEAALERFQSHCDTYFAQVEHEVVRLALSIAARVLHRESQIDPLLLSGAVRVALGQLSESTDVVLRVPACDLALWAEMLRLIPNLPLQPQLTADGALSTGECQIETKMGSIDLGVKAQLAEIERGFFDLLDRRQQLKDQRHRQEA